MALLFDMSTLARRSAEGAPGTELKRLRAQGDAARAQGAMAPMGLASRFEPQLSLATGMLGAIPAGLHGLGTLATGGSMEDAADAVRRTQSALTYTPRSAGSRAGLGRLSGALEAASAPAQWAGGAALRHTDSPLLATLAEMTADPLNFLPGLGKLGAVAPRGITTYTGSARPWDEPLQVDFDKLGGAENTWMEGYGLYSTENPDIARWYRRQDVERKRDTTSLGALSPSPTGSIVRLDVPDPDELLHRDVSLSYQPQPVKDALSLLAEDMADTGQPYLKDILDRSVSPLGEILQGPYIGANKRWLSPARFNPTEFDYAASDFHGAFLRRPVEPDPRITSHVLQSYGVPGSRYLTGETSSLSPFDSLAQFNHVTWDPSRVKALDQNAPEYVDAGGDMSRMPTPMPDLSQVLFDRHLLSPQQVRQLPASQYNDVVKDLSRALNAMPTQIHQWIHGER